MGIGALVAFTAISAGASIVKGIQTNSAMTEQGIAYMKQAQIAQYESQYLARQKQREVDKSAARQVMALAKNGIVTNSGSPLDILHETIVLGRDEVNAIKRRGLAQVEMYNTEADNAFKKGRAGLIGGVFDAASTVGSMYMKMGQAGFGKSQSTVNSFSGVITGWSPSVGSSGGSAIGSPKGYWGTLPRI